MLIYVLIPIAAAACFFCVSLSLLVHLTDFFFLASSLRYACLLLLVLISLSIFFSLFKKIRKDKSQLDSVCSKKWILVFLLVVLIISSVLVFYLPRPKIPTGHTLLISVPPSGEPEGNTIKVNRIRRIIDAPEPGSAYVDFEDVLIRNGEYQIEDESLYLREPAELRYETYFSGCISIFFETSPESRLVDVAFDQVQERYSLYSKEDQETEVRLCAPVSLDRLSLKWQMIVMFLYICDGISIFSVLILVSLFLYFLFLSRSDKSSKLLRSVSFIACIAVVLSASVFQIYEQIMYPHIRNERIPPIRTTILSEDISFHHIYQETLHTKKFSHYFIMTFLDIYPKVGNVYVHQDTLDAFNFNTFEFQRWFGVFGLQSMDNCPIKISDDDLMDLILNHDWLKKELDLEARDIVFNVNYLRSEPEDFILIFNDGYDIYLIPDSILGNF
jgi:hypothetical protein